MDALRSSLLAGIVGALVLFTVGEISAQVAKDVSVINTPNVNVVNTPSVNASITNTPSVSVTGTPNVSVSNTPTVNVGNQPTVQLAPGSTVTNAPTSPVGRVTGIFLTQGQTFRNQFLLPSQSIPVGKRFVIQYVSVFANVDPGQRPRAFLSGRLSDPASANLNVFLPLQFEGNFGGQDFWSASHPVSLYTDGQGNGQELFMHCERDQGVGIAGCTFQVVGYLVDIPQ